MRREAFDMRYYNTYYYANIVNNILGDPFDYLRTIHDLFENDGDLDFCTPFPKHTALHRFIWFCIELEFQDDMKEEKLERVIRSKKKLLPINRAMSAHGIEHTSFAEWLSEQQVEAKDASSDHLDEYFQDLRQEQAYDDFLEQTTDEVFFIMFMNRGLLLSLNHLVSGYVQNIEVEGREPEVKALFDRPGLLKRQYIPKWARKAVFFRDRGKCVFCNRDLTGLISLYSPNNYDHVIPLADGGINDVTNLQLLCEPCNLKKGDRSIGTSSRYERWFSKDK